MKIESEYMAEKCNIGPVPASLLRWSLLVLAVFWAGALIFASYVASLAEPGPAWSSFALAVYRPRRVHLSSASRAIVSYFSG